MPTYTDVTRSTIQGHPGPASIEVQFTVACRNVGVTNSLAELKEQVDKFKQTLMSSATVLANEKNNPSPEKTTSPEASEQYANECQELAEILKNLGRELKKLETELDNLTEMDQEKINDFRDEMSSYVRRMDEMVNAQVTDITTFYADKAHVDDAQVRKDLHAILAKHTQDMKALRREILDRVKRADPNAPELPAEVIEKSASKIEPVLKAAQYVVDARRAEQAKFEQQTANFSRTVTNYRNEVDDLLKKFDRALPGRAMNHVTPLPPPLKSFSHAK